MDWVKIIALCGTIIGALAFLSGLIIYMVGKMDADVSKACRKIDEQGIRIDEQGKRTDKLIYAFMEFQRDTDRLIKDCQEDILDLEKVIPEFKKRK